MTAADAQAACGCCTPAVDTLPQPPRNAAGLAAIDYRLGTFAAFREAMVRSIGRDERLRGWTARRSDDYGIALIEMWAYVADILTFYDERIANEAFLRTARQRESVRRLVGLLGYRPSPGLAAVADMAFTLEPDAALELHDGLRLQSVPGPDEKPQRFETVEAIHARAGLNRLPILPRPVAIAPLARERGEAPLRPGSAAPPAGSPVVAWDADGAELKQALAPRRRAGRTLAAWTPPVQADLAAFGSRLAVRGRTFGVFGRNQPLDYLETGISTSGVPQVKRATTLVPALPQTGEPARTLPLDALYPDVREGADVLVVQKGATTHAPAGFARRTRVVRSQPQPLTYGPLQDTVTQLELDLRATAQPLLLDGFGSTISLSAFVTADDGAIWTSVRAAGAAPWTAWTPWRSLGGDVAGFDAARQPDGSARLFAAGRGGALWQRLSRTGAGGFGPWQRVDAEGAVRFDRVATAIGATGRIDLVARAADGTLRHSSREPAGPWSRWAPLRPAPDLTVSRHVTVLAAGVLHVVAIGSDGTLRATDRAADGSFGAWTTLGGPFDMLAAVVRPTTQRLDVVMRARETKAVWHAWKGSAAAAWTAPVDRGGAVESLDAAAGGAGLLVIVARGLDTRAYRNMETAVGTLTGWGPISPAGTVDAGVGRLPDTAVPGAVEAMLRLEDGTLAGLRPSTAPTGFPWSPPEPLGPPTWPVDDRRLVTVHELLPGAPELSDRDYPNTIDGSLVHVPLERAPVLERGRRVVLDDDRGEGHSALVTDTSEVELDGGGEADHLAIAFSPALPRPLETETAALLGNVARATHGAAQADEVLGDGDASVPLQSFELERHPVTLVPSAGAPRGRRAELEVRVDGIRWDEVEELYGRGPADRVYVRRTDDEGRASIRFGDGRTGARPTTGRGNVRAHYRVGIGRIGNVPAGALRNPLDRPTGMRSAQNPARAGGGVDREGIDAARAAGPDSVRTFGRIVSLRDFADAARDFGAVAKARASLAWTGGDEQVELVVAGPGGAELGAQTLNALLLDLDSRRDPNRNLRVTPHDPAPVVIGATVAPAPDRVAEEVAAAARGRLLDLLSFERQEFGASLHLSEVYATLQGTPGVVWAEVTELRRKDAATATAPAETVPIAPTELAALEDPDHDLSVTLA